MDGKLIERALSINDTWFMLGNEHFEADGATFIRNRRWPEIRGANHITGVTGAIPADFERLLARAEREYQGVPHRRFDVDFRAPPAFEARLAIEGYECSEALVFVLETDTVPRNRRHSIRAVLTEADWKTYEDLQLLDWAEGCERRNALHEVPLAHTAAQAQRAKAPPMRYWFACVDGEPQAYCSSWALDGVGQVEDLFTHPDFRHRGLATALIHHCVADARTQGAGPVVIVADAHDTPKEMYAAMGFRPVVVKREYWKNVPTP